MEGWRDKCCKLGAIISVSSAECVRGSELTYRLKRYVCEHSTEVFVEEAFENVQGDVGQAGVDVGVNGQNDSVSANNAAGGDVTLKQDNGQQQAIISYIDLH